MERPLAPILSSALFLGLFAAAVWALWGYDFAPTPGRLIGVGAVVALSGLGYARFGGRFVRPAWKRWGKLLAVIAVAWLAMVWLGPWGIVLPVAHQVTALVGHVVICRRHGIDWWTIEPRDRYIALQEKWARGDFT